MTEKEQTQTPKPHTISFELFSKATNKTTQLVNNDDLSFFVDGRHRWFEYVFQQPTYLTAIRIISDGYDDWNNFEIEITHIDGTKHQEKIKVSDGEVSLALGKLCNGFRFRPDSKLFGKQKILRVVASGLTLDEFHAFEWTIKEFRRRESDLNSREVAVKELEAEIESLTTSKASLATEVGKLQAQRDELGTTIEKSSSKIETLEAKIADYQSSVKSEASHLRDLEARVKLENSKLDELTRELRLFPSEISGFVREGNRNIVYYLSIAVPFLLILIVVTTSLFWKAVDLTQIWRQEEGVEVWTIFLTRLPFVLVALAIVEATGYIIGRLIYEVIRINRQRLELSRLSIVAKDVSAASAHSTDMTDQEVFEKETKLKMELLREHLKGISGGEFEYKGSAIVSAVAGVANRFSGAKSGDGASVP